MVEVAALIDRLRSLRPVILLFKQIEFNLRMHVEGETLLLGLGQRLLEHVARVTQGRLTIRREHVAEHARGACGPPRHGRIWNVDGSGLTIISSSDTRVRPSTAEPSNPSPSSNAASSSAGAMATDFSVPNTSVNHRRMKRTSRSSTVRKANSCCLSIVSNRSMRMLRTSLTHAVSRHVSVRLRGLPPA